MNSLSKIALFTLLSGAVFAAQAADPHASMAMHEQPAAAQTQLNNVKDGDSVDFTFVQQGNLSLLQDIRAQ